jgi:cobalt/nickel transport system permease protein
MAIHALVERFEARNSSVHRADARVKLLVALAYIFSITLTREGDWVALILLAIPIAGIIVMSKLTPALVLRRSLLMLPFVLVALPLLFTRPGEPVTSLPLLGWGISAEGTIAVATILTKSWLSVIVAIVLTSTTQHPELLRALRALRVPRLLVATIESAYRYLFVIGEEASRMLRARASRSAAIEGRRPNGKLRWRATIAGHLVGTLFLRSIDRSERVYAAMHARGYSGEPRFLDSSSLRTGTIAVATTTVLFAYVVQIAVRL